MISKKGIEVLSFAWSVVLYVWVDLSIGVRQQVSQAIDKSYIPIAAPALRQLIL